MRQEDFTRYWPSNAIKEWSLKNVIYFPLVTELIDVTLADTIAIAPSKRHKDIFYSSQI